MQIRKSISNVTQKCKDELGLEENSFNNIWKTEYKCSRMKASRSGRSKITLPFRGQLLLNHHPYVAVCGMGRWSLHWDQQHPASCSVHSSCPTVDASILKGCWFSLLQLSAQKDIPWWANKLMVASHLCDFHCQSGSVWSCSHCMRVSHSKTLPQTF